MREGWTRVTINDIAEIKSGKRLPKGETLTDKKTVHPYIRGRDIKNGKITFDDPKYITYEVYEKIKRYTVKYGDICLTIVANIGDIGQVPKFLDGANLTENAVKLVKIREDCYPEFLKYSLSAPVNKKQMELSAAGAAQSKLGIYKVKAIKVDIPNSIDTQRKIAGILSAYDYLIENNTRRIAILEEIAQRIYKEWFVHFRYPGHENDKLVESELGMIPEGWEVKTIKEVYNTASGGTPSRRIDEYYGGNINWLKTRELNDNYVLDTEEKITELGLDNSSVKIFPENTVIMAMYGATIGKLGITSTETGTNQACCAFLPKHDTYGFAFIFSHLLENRRKIISYSMGAAQQNLSQILIKKFNIPLPPVSLIRNFNHLTEQVFSEMMVLFRKNRNLRQIRNLLLPKLISGKVDVSKLDIDIGAEA